MDDRPDNRARGRPPDERGDGFSQHPDAETLSAYLDDRLPPRDRAVVVAHAAGCADCRRELAELRATVALLRGLPQYAPRRSFRLTPAQTVRPTAPGWGWFARLLPALPALRAATVAVAILLLAVSVGDVLVHRDDEDPSRQAFEAPATTRDEAVGTEPAAPASEGAGGEPSLAMEAAAPTTAPTAAAGNQAPAAVQDAPMAAQAAPTTPAGPEAARAAGAPEAAGAAQPEEEAPAADEAPQTGAAAPPPAATATFGPTATAIAGPTPADDAAATGAAGDGAAQDADADGDEDDDPSGWRLAEVGLGLLLLWLIVTVAGLQRLRRRA
jgi:anti-sigma factor RsiW